MFDEDGRQLFTGLAAHPALALEVSARFFLGDFGGAVGFVLPMLVHAFQPERHPAAAGLEVDDFELGKFLQHAVGAEVETGEHLLERVAGDVPAKFAVTIRTGLRQDAAGAFVDADGDAQV